MSVADLFDHALPSLRRRVEQATLALNVEIPESVAQMVCRTDAVAVQQILLNLVDNACKHGESAIDIRAQNSGGQLEIRVIDHGPGIDPARLKRLFQAFSKSKTDTVPGIGLGLFLSRRLARELGGDLALVDEASETTFLLSLPA